MQWTMGGHLLLRTRCSWDSNGYEFLTERSNVDLPSSAGHFAGSCNRFRVLFIPKARVLFTSRSKTRPIIPARCGWSRVVADEFEADVLSLLVALAFASVG